MNGISDILDLINKNQGLVTLGIGWLVYRMKITDLPHMLEELQRLGQRIANLEGSRVLGGRR